MRDRPTTPADFYLVLPFTPRSKKNRLRFGKGRVFTGAKDRSTTEQIKAALVEQLGCDPLGQNPKIPADHEVYVEISRAVGRRKSEDAVIVQVWDLGPRESSRGWDVDVSNQVESILDAMQGYVYQDDAQVMSLHSTRFRCKDYDFSRLIKPAPRTA